MKIDLPCLIIMLRATVLIEPFLIIFEKYYRSTVSSCKPLYTNVTVTSIYLMTDNSNVRVTSTLEIWGIDIDHGGTTFPIDQSCPHSIDSNFNKYRDHCMILIITNKLQYAREEYTSSFLSRVWSFYLLSIL